MGFFLIMIILMIIAIALAKKNAVVAWVIFGVGVGLQFLSIFGWSSHYAAMGFSVDMTEIWVIFAVIALLSAGIIVTRTSGKANKKTENAASDPSGDGSKVTAVSDREEVVNVSPVTPLQERVLVPEIDDDDFYDEKTVASFDAPTVAVEEDDDDKTLPFFMEEKPSKKVVLTRCSDGYRIECTGDLFSVGKSLNSSNYMIPGSQKISRLHATFYEKDGNYYILDNSKNGTTVNGVAVPKTQQMPVQNGDKIKFADVEFVFNVE